MAENQEIKRYRVLNLPSTGLISGTNYELYLGGGQYRNYVVNDSNQLIAQDGKEFIECDTVDDLRNLDARQIWAIQNGYYKGVTLNGYYNPNDTQAPIQYYLSGTTEVDDGGSVFEVGGVKLEHEFIDRIDLRYYGIVEGVDSTTYPNNEIGLNNYLRMIRVLKKGIPVMVDGEYLISITSDSALDNEINEDIIIKGIDRKESKLVFNSISGGVFIRTAKNIEISGLSIECSGNTMTTIARYEGIFDASFTVNNINASGDIRLLQGTVPENYEFDQFSGFRTINIENSNFENVYNSSGSRAIVNLTDTPVQYFNVINNKVHNFSYRFINAGISNGHPGTTFIWQNRLLTTIKDNTVTCDIDYDAKAVNSGAISTYYCFALIEGKDVICTDNSFEGIHLVDFPEIVVYDNYFSCINLSYERNTYTNIVNLSEGGN